MTNKALNTLFFRKAVAADAATIVAIVNSAYRGEASRKGWTTEADYLDGARTDLVEINQLIAAHGSVILLCQPAGETRKNGVPPIVGTLHLSKIEDEGECAGYFSMFAIDPDLQAGGIGKQMMQAAEELVQHEWSAKKMLMDVIPLRRELLAFYTRRGYQLTGKVKPFPVNPTLWTPKTAALESELVLARMEKRLA